jgi:hypothetical protein
MSHQENEKTQTGYAWFVVTTIEQLTSNKY